MHHKPLEPEAIAAMIKAVTSIVNDETIDDQNKAEQVKKILEPPSDQYYKENELINLVQANGADSPLRLSIIKELPLTFGVLFKAAGGSRQFDANGKEQHSAKDIRALMLNKPLFKEMYDSLTPFFSISAIISLATIQATLEEGLSTAANTGDKRSCKRLCSSISLSASISRPSTAPLLFNHDYTTRKMLRCGSMSGAASPELEDGVNLELCGYGSGAETPDSTGTGRNSTVFGRLLLSR